MNVSDKFYFDFINNITFSYGGQFSSLAKRTSILKNCKSLFVTYESLYVHEIKFINEHD